MCENQETNTDKCIKTTKQCLKHEDICMSQVAWGLPPYWVPYGDRMFNISKTCATSRSCLQQKSAKMPFCKRDWYNDWHCIECCTGDKCDYYVTLAGMFVQPSYWISLISFLYLYFFVINI